MSSFTEDALEDTSPAKEITGSDDTNRMSDFPVSPYNGGYCFRSHYYDAGGVRHQVRRSFKTERLAIEGYLQFQKVRDSGGFTVGKQLTVATAVDWWIEILRDEGCRPTTLGGHRTMLDLYVIPHIGKVQLSKLTTEHLRTVYRAMVAKGMATSSIQAVSRKMRAMLARAVSEKRITENVAKLVIPPKGAPAKKHVVYSPEQIQKLAQALATDRMAALWVLAVYSGARRGELAGLRWSQVDFGTRSICINWTRTISTNGVEEGGTKTDAGERTIRLPQVVFDILADWKVRQTTERMALGRRWDAGDYVFTSRDGNAYRPGSISERLCILTGREGMPPIRTHALRHSLITNALKSRIDTAVVAPFVGHSDPRVTATYQHVSPEMAYDHLESLFDQF